MSRVLSAKAGVTDPILESLLRTPSSIRASKTSLPLALFDIRTIEESRGFYFPL